MSSADLPAERIAASAAGLAKVLFVVFLVLAGISLLFGRRAVI